MKQLAAALLQYAQDHGDRFPPANRWLDEIQPYVQDPKTFRCPKTPREWKYAYGFNEHLSGKTTASLESPAETILLYETNGGLRNAHGDPADPRIISRVHGVANVVLADGHHGWINPDFYPRKLRTGEWRVK